jgi:deoxyribodipyrimidine photo-lyase
MVLHADTLPPEVSLIKVPEIRIRRQNGRPVRPEGQFVLYWMIAARRAAWNFALQRAVEWAEKLGKSLVVLEALRCDYPWANDRLHRFILEGVADNAAAFRGTPARYYPYVEPAAGAGKGLLAALAERACLVVTDEFPAFFLPHMVTAAAARVPVLLEQVDGNGLLPLRAADRDYPTAYAFRRFLQKQLPVHLGVVPAADPLAGAALPETSLAPEILRRWPPATPQQLAAGAALLANLPVDHSVAPVATRGGAEAARRMLRQFLTDRLADYPERRNEPEAEATSGLSPYLHFGHLSAHQVFAELAAQEAWHLGRLSFETRGKRGGWWGMSEAAEAFLDQLVTWRELGFNFCGFRDDCDRFESLPGWALATLAKHAGDPRPYLYTPEEFAAGGTHDPLWNAAQMQLVREGRLHNYLRMLWGKKILEWSPTPQEAAAVMIELNNRYALDGRDPNSYSGIFWCLGRYDRPWGPERPIIGTVRYMSSGNTARKVRVKDYIRRYAP